MLASFQLEPRPPFSFQQALAFLGRFPPALGEQRIVGESLLKAFRRGGQTLLVEVESAGSAEAPLLAGTLLSDRAIDAPTRAAMRDRIGFFLSVDDDLAPFYALAQDDPPFRAVVERLYGYHQVKFPSPFENACWAILTQRTSARVARVWKQRLVERFGGRLEHDGAVFWAFPEPPDLALAAPGELLALVPDLRRASYLEEVAQAFCQVDEAWLRSGPLEQVEAWLRRVPGLGEWSVRFILLRGLGRLEQDLGPDGSVLLREVARSAAAVYGGPPSPARLRTLANHYGLWQGYWAHYLRAAG